MPNASLSVVIPAFNEAGNIGALVRETVGCVPRDLLHEVIVVDDASDDATAEEVKALLGEVPQLRYLRHARRSGQSAAIRSGVHAATGDMIATMDGDGQNDPRDIAKLLALHHNGCVALAGGIRVNRRAESSKRIASRFANWLRNAILNDRCPDTGCGIKVIRRDVFLTLPYFSGMHRYLPALVLAYGYEAAYAPVNDRPRRAGVSKYTNLGRGIVGIYDLIGVRWLIKRTVLPGANVLRAESRDASAHVQPVSREELGCLPN